MEIFLHSETWIALLTLILLEIVLGIDNIIFISIITDRLPAEKQSQGRIIGLSLALVFRIGLLLGITYIIGFDRELFSLFGHPFGGRDLILAAGGLFLLAKSTSEIHQKLEGNGHGGPSVQKPAQGLLTTVLQIIVLDIVFSFDSILTAIGLTDHVIIMIVAVTVAMVVMMVFSGAVSRFINQHPTLQMLALAFLILIGFMLILDAFGTHVPKGYVYFAVAFSLVVEMMNMRLRKSKKIINVNKQPEQNEEH